MLTDPENQRSSYRCGVAQRSQVPVVLPAYVDACLDSATLLDHEPFLAAGSTKMDAFSEGKIVGELERFSLPARTFQRIFASFLKNHISGLHLNIRHYSQLSFPGL